MADTKSKTYVCVKGCSVDGERVSVGDKLPTDLDPGKISRLISMGRIVLEEATEAIQEAKARIAEEQARIAAANEAAEAPMVKTPPIPATAKKGK